MRGTSINSDLPSKRPRRPASLWPSRWTRPKEFPGTGAFSGDIVRVAPGSRHQPCLGPRGVQRVRQGPRYRALV